VSRSHGVGWLRLVYQFAGVNDLAQASNSLKVESVAVYFDEHKCAVSVKAGLHDVATVKIVVHQLS
jgi:hypothetical protein